MKWQQVIRRASKRVVRNTKGIKLKMRNFFQAIEGTKTLKVEIIDAMLKDAKGTNKYMEDILGTKVENNLYFI